MFYIMFTACQYHLHLVPPVACLDIMNRLLLSFRCGKASGQGTGQIINCSSQGECSHILKQVG